MPLPPRASASSRETARNRPNYRRYAAIIDSRVRLARLSSGWKRLTVTRGHILAGPAVELDRQQPARTGLGGAFQLGRWLVVEDGGLILAGSVGDRRHQIAPSLRRRPPASALDSPAMVALDPALAKGHVRQVGKAADLVRGQQVALGIDRVGREIEAEGLALRRHPLGQGPARVPRQADRGDAARFEPPPNRPCWPLVRWSCAEAACARIVSAAAWTDGRSGLSASNAPAAARLSSWRRLSNLGSIRSAKSSRFL